MVWLRTPGLRSVMLSAAALVKLATRISSGRVMQWIRNSMRSVITVDLPVPAPAWTMMNGSRAVMAATCCRENRGWVMNGFGGTGVGIAERIRSSSCRLPLSFRFRFCLIIESLMPRPPSSMALMRSNSSL